MNNVSNILFQFWENAYQFWTTPSARIQAVAIGLSIFLAWTFNKQTKPKILKFSLDPTRSAWLQRSIHIFSQLLLPFFVLLFSLSCRGLLNRFELASTDLINPFVNATSAWLIYRLVSGLTHNRFWLRLAAVLAFGMAALQSFGLLEPTFGFLESASFAVGKSKLSVLDLVNGIFILLFLLWISSLLGSAGESRIRQLPDLPPSLQVLLAKVVRVLLIFLSFLVAMSTIGLDLSSFALLGGAIGVGIGFGLQKVVSNLVSGLILLLDRSIKPGDD